MSTLKFLSLNARGLNDYSKRQTLYDWLRDINCNIVFLQETHYVTDKENIYNARWQGSNYHCFSTSTHSGGVSILFQKNLHFTVHSVYKLDDGRILLINMEYEQNVITLVNIYAPNSENERCKFFKKLASWISQYCLNEENIILAGDFNSSHKAKTKCCKIINDLKYKYNLIDIWDKINPEKEGNTWCDSNSTPQTRIDYIFSTKNLCYPIEKIFLRKPPDVSNTRMSDHLSFIFYCTISMNRRGIGYWKMNTSILHDMEFCKIINDFFENIPEYISKEKDPQIRWEIIKYKIKDLCIGYSTNKNKDIKTRIKNLEKKLEDIELSNSENRNISDRENTEKEINNLYAYRAKGAKVRARAHWIDEGERNTSYFLKLENKHQSQNAINKLIVRGKSLNENQEILNALSSYYENLYSSNYIAINEIDQYLKNIKLINSVSDKDKEHCDRTPTIDELAEAVYSMKLNKSPGLDGIPVEFYKMFWKHIKFYLLESLLKSFEIGELSSSQRASVLSLIHKKGSMHNLDNYRPISLTNCDYKILAFIFAKRLQLLIDKLINKNQTGYIKGRFIGENARLVLDIYDYCEENDTEGILLFADFQKAFDSVEWDFLFQTLQKFNFGKKFLKWIKILYTKPYFHVKNNNWLTRKCKMSRGIRQGCPVSALLFLFVIEILVLKINASENIQGFKLGQRNELKCLQHADDCTLPVKNAESLRAAILIIKNFGKVSGTKLNIEKTEGILLGPLKNSLEYIDGIRMTNDSVKSLGIFLGHDKVSNNEKNWLNKLKEFEKILDSWRIRKLTLFGKCTIINSLIVSKLLYAFTVLENPSNEYIKSINRIIYNFIWGKRERIKRKSIIRQINEGGLGLTDLECKLKSIKAGWIRRLFDKKNTLRKYIDNILQSCGIDFEYLLRSNIINPNDLQVLEKFPKFYKEVLCSFNECKSTKQPRNLLAVNLWLNNSIKHKGQPLFLKSWARGGILYVKDMFTSEGIKDINTIKEIIDSKRNYICEYLIMKNVIKKLDISYDNAKNTHIQKPYLYCSGKIINPEIEKSGFYYKILLSKNPKKQ